MIWYYLLLFIGSVLSFMTSWLPVVETLPFNMDEYFSTAVGSFKSFMEIFPPLQVIWSAFLIYVGFRVILLTMRLLRIIR